MNHEEIQNLDILTWWKNNSRYSPAMAAMVRDLLTIQASTVASESCFSTVGRVLDEKRRTLTPMSMEIYICYKDYIDAITRQQDKVKSEDSSSDPEIEHNN